MKQINLSDPKPFVTPEETAPEDLEVVEEESLDSAENTASDTPDFTEGKMNKKKSTDEAQIKLFDE